MVFLLLLPYGIHANELELVLKAQKRENLKTCLTGQYPSLCKQHLLTQSQKKQTLSAQKRENLKTCLTGQYPSLCKQHLLTQNEKNKL